MRRDSLVGQGAIAESGVYDASWDRLRRHVRSQENKTLTRYILSMLAGYTQEMGARNIPGERSKILKRSGLRSGRSDDDAILHSVVLFEGLDELSDGGTLLADGDVDTVELLGLVARVVPSLLVQHGIQSDSSLAGLTVTNDQLTLTAADGHHGVDRLETSLHRLVDGLTGQNARSLDLSTAALLGIERTLAVNGVTEGVDDTSKQFRTDGDINLRATCY